LFGETRFEHVAGHAADDLSIAYQGVFYGEPTEVINDAWASKGSITPTTENGVDIYRVPYSNAGYQGRYAGQGKNLDYVTIITRAGTNQIITGYPSSGN
jgi:hypothetical protein